MEYNEQEAIRLLSNGDERGFRAIYDQYAVMVLKIAVRFLQDQQAAEDVVQDLFTRLWGVDRNLYLNAKDFKFYLIGAAKNTVKNALMHRAKRQLHEAQYANEYEIHSHSDDTFDTNYSVLMEATEKLPPQQKQIFKLAKIEGLSHEVISKRMKISLSTVNNHMIAALKHIRTYRREYLSPKHEKSENEILREQIVLLRKSGLKYGEIAIRLNIGLSKVYFQYQKSLAKGA
jgi:RNA polymerase sigma-70 factor (family 1)